MGFDPQTGNWVLDDSDIVDAATLARGAPTVPGIDQAAIQGAAAAARAPGPAMGAPALARPQPSPLSLVPQLQPTSRNVTGTTTTTTQRRMGGEERQQVDQLAKSFDEQIRLSQQQRELAVQQARDQDEAAQEVAIFKAERAERRQKLIDAGEVQLQGAMSEYKKQFDRYKGMEIKDYFADKSTASNVLTAIALGLGELGKMRPGGTNPVLQLLQQDIQNDFTRQKLAIDKQADILAKAERNADLVESYRDKALKNLDLKEAAALDAIEARWKSNLAALGVDKAAIDADEVANALRQGKALKLQSIFEGTRAQISTAIERQMSQGTAGGGDPLRIMQMQRMLEQDREKDDQRRIDSWDGAKTAMAPTAAEGKAMREQLGNARSLLTGLDGIKTKVKDLGLMDRLAGGWSSKQQEIAGELDVILAPMTQTLGAGTPQDREAARKLQAYSASIKQNPATAAKNIEAMQTYLQSHYDNRYQSTAVPGSATDRPGQQPASAPKPAGDQRARYQAAIEKARAAGNQDLVRRLEAEMGAL